MFENLFEIVFGFMVVLETVFRLVFEIVFKNMIVIAFEIVLVYLMDNALFWKSEQKIYLSMYIFTSIWNYIECSMSEQLLEKLGKIHENYMKNHRKLNWVKRVNYRKFRAADTRKKDIFHDFSCNFSDQFTFFPTVVGKW